MLALRGCRGSHFGTLRAIFIDPGVVSAHFGLAVRCRAVARHRPAGGMGVGVEAAAMLGAHTGSFKTKRFTRVLSLL